MVPGSIPVLTVKVGPWSQRQHSGTDGKGGTVVPEAAFRYWRCRWDRGPRQHSGTDGKVGTVVPGSIPGLTVKVRPWSHTDRMKASSDLLA
ncbi:hypothetical protein NUKP82_39200 [Klebsiella variicola]|nr:hypothetical protein NUKP82_39200 [Klebsiella variicola]